MNKCRARILTALAVVLAGSTFAQAAADEPIALSLRLTTEGDVQRLEILVTNVSSKAVEITSEGCAPPWSVWLWFKWRVDDKDAEYLENVAYIQEIKESWRIPPGGVVLWGSIPLRYLSFRTESSLQSAVKDSGRHSITILPNERWKGLKVKPGTIEIGKQKTEPAPKRDAAVGLH